MRTTLGVVLVLIVFGTCFVTRERGDEASPQVTRDEATHRSPNAGPVVGFVDDGGRHVWLGIPFARPPVGDLRWRAPRPALAWADRREALSIGNLCPQFPSLLSGAGEDPSSDEPVGDEDCLVLNVWAPAFAPDRVPEGDDALPVMVWIHGGGNSIGHGGSYDGANLAARHALILVTINYRLGPLGWFLHPALHGDGASAEDRSGNFGTLDVIAALGWVRDNIASFGGNPGKVTIFGESAGGTDVLAMLASPLATGLFHRAIVQSGGLRMTTPAEAANYRDAEPAGHPASSREIVNRLLVSDGLAADRSAAKSHQDAMNKDALATFLRNKSAADILNTFEDRNFGMISTPEIIGDGTVLPMRTLDELFGSRGGANAVPIILGSNRDEPKLFMVRHPRWVENRFWLFPTLKDEVAYQRTSRYLSDSWKARGVDLLARLLRASQGPTVFAYRFDWDEEPSIMGYDLSVALGAAHGLEIAFAFGSFEGGLGLDYIYDEDRRDGRDALSESMMSYWAEFAYSGNPGQGRDGSEVAWLPWGTSGQTMLVLDTPEDRGIRMSSEEISAESVRARLVSDDTFSDQEEHCRMYADLFLESEHWRQDQYDHLGRQGCREYDPAGFGDL